MAIRSSPARYRTRSSKMQPHGCWARTETETFRSNESVGGIGRVPQVRPSVPGPKKMGEAHHCIRHLPLLFLVLLFGSSAVLQAQSCKSNPLPPQSDWPVYGGQAEGDHYSPLSQINRGNVHKLKEAWKFDAAEEGGLETNPIIVGQSLFAYTASQKVIALDAATGKLLWKFDSGVHSSQPARGVAYWSDGIHGRILAGVMNYLY